MCPIVSNNLVVKIFSVFYCSDKHTIWIMASNRYMHEQLRVNNVRITNITNDR